jgi:hypothetical protein
LDSTDPNTISKNSAADTLSIFASNRQQSAMP